MNLRDIFSNSHTQNRAVQDEEQLDSGGFALSYGQVAYINQSTKLSAVFAAIELISNSIAQLPIHIRDNNGDILDNHPLNQVFLNNVQSKYTMIKQLVIDMLINGNGIAYIKRDNDGMPNGLIYCPKGTYTINYPAFNQNLYYLIPELTASKIQPKDVIHIVKNTIDGVQGKGLLYYAHDTLLNAFSAQGAAQSYYDSGCAINGVLKSSKHLSKKQKQDIQEAWNTAHNANSAMSIPVLPVDLDYIQLSGSAADAQLLEARLFSVQEIARYFNINPVLLGDLSHSSYSTIEAAQLEFLTHTLAPYIELIQDELNRKLASGLDVTIDIDEDHLLKADKSATATYLKTLTSAGIMSINEARHHLGLRPIEGGDKHIIPYTDINQNAIDGKEQKQQDENDK